MDLIIESKFQKTKKKHRLKSFPNHFRYKSENHLSINGYEIVGKKIEKSI